MKLPILPIHRRDGDRHDDQVQEQEEVTGVTASWHDRGAAKKWTARKLPAPLPTKRTPPRRRRPRAPSENRRNASLDHLYGPRMLDLYQPMTAS